MKSEKIINDVMAMSRGRVVVDEDLENIANAIRKKNIIVITPAKGLKDPEIIKSHILSGRIFITNNSVDFVKDATSYEYSIIATESIKFKEPEKLAKTISDAIIEFDLWSLINSNKCFILKLQNDGKHILKFLQN